MYQKWYCSCADIKSRTAPFPVQNPSCHLSSVLHRCSSCATTAHHLKTHQHLKTHLKTHQRNIVALESVMNVLPKVLSCSV